MVDDDIVRVGVVTVAVVLLMVVASFGFQSVSSNPLVPKTDVQMRDANDEFVLNTSANTDILTIEHRGGEPVPLDDVKVILGPRTQGLNYTASNNWTATEGPLTTRVKFNGENVTDGATFKEGDVLTLVKTAGRSEAADDPEFTVRLYHYPSQQVFARQTVQIE